LGLAIFGITEVPTGGVEFDTADFVADGSTESDGPTASMGTDYAPPPEATSQAQVDPELGAQEAVFPPTDAAIADPSTTTTTAAAAAPTISGPTQLPASSELPSQTSEWKNDEIAELD
jgi:hypothetical protein